jgi:hypothetical protein
LTTTLGVRVAQQQQRIAELIEPRIAHTMVSELIPVGQNITRSMNSSLHRLPAATENLVLILSLPEDYSYLEYELAVQRVESMKEGSTWSRSGVLRSAEGFIAISLPRSMLDPGAYVLTIYGIAENDKARLADYHLNLEVEA